MVSQSRSIFNPRQEQKLPIDPSPLYYSFIPHIDGIDKSKSATMKRKTSYLEPEGEELIFFNGVGPNGKRLMPKEVRDFPNFFLKNRKYIKPSWYINVRSVDYHNLFINDLIKFFICDNIKYLQNTIYTYLIITNWNIFYFRLN